MHGFAFKVTFFSLVLLFNSTVFAANCMGCHQGEATTDHDDAQNVKVYDNQKGSSHSREGGNLS